MFYYIIDSIKIGKTKHLKNSSIITLSSKNSRAKKKLKINDIDLYYRIEEFNTEHNLNSTVIKFLNPKSFHMTKYVEQILVTNFLIKKRLNILSKSLFKNTLRIKNTILYMIIITS